MNLSHIIRIKKFKPFYELYKVKENKSFFVKEGNDFSEINKNLYYVRLVISSILCVEGERSIPDNDYKFKVKKDMFYFSHQIISNVENLKYSTAKINNNKLKQIWIDKIDYEKLLSPILNILKNRVEVIISEKSSCLIDDSDSIELIDGKVINLLKPNKEGTNQISLLNKDITNNYKSLNNVTYTRDIQNVVKFDYKKQKNYLYFYILIPIVFIFLNIAIILPKFNPILDFKINYFLNIWELKKIENSNEIIERNKIIKKSLKNEMPLFISNLDKIFEKIPNVLIKNLIDFNLISNGEVKIKFKNKNVDQFLRFIDDNKNLKIKTENLDNFILIKFNINDF